MAIHTRTTEVADGVHRCGTSRVNWYLVEGDDRVTVVDAGYPTHFDQLVQRLTGLDYALSDVEACILTHAHPDHIGFANRLAESADVPIWLHEAEVGRARAAGDPSLWGFIRNLWRPAVLQYFVETLRSKGTSIPPVTDVETYADGDTLAVPGRPHVIHVPGHTAGEVVFHLPDRELLFCGDAVATLDFETWTGSSPRLLPAWLNQDHELARQSVRQLEDLGDVTLLPGHGDPWHGSMAEAVRMVQTP